MYVLSIRECQHVGEDRVRRLQRLIEKVVIRDLFGVGERHPTERRTRRTVPLEPVLEHLLAVGEQRLALLTQFDEPTPVRLDIGAEKTFDRTD